MRKVALLLALGLVAVFPSTALAATDTDSATLSVNVATAITVTFTDGVENFGAAALPGTVISPAGPELAYEVSTNAPLGFSLNVTQTSPASSAVTFAISKDGVAFAPADSPTAPSPVANGWRTESAAGTFAYTDDAKVTIGASAGGAFSMTLDYIATTL